jgi:alpha-beta hydrolase superfamily lysophospholipase
MNDVLTRLTVSSGAELAVRDWSLPAARTSRGTVLLVHGLGEHSGRYGHVAAKLNEWGFTVRGYDHQGHGLSSGARGSITHSHALVDDLADVMDATRRQMPSNRPLILLGHSMGGAVAGTFVAQARRPVDGLVMSSPALAHALSPVLKLAMAILPRVAPGMIISNGLDASFISHDPAVVQAYKNDPLVHDRISVRLGRFIVDHGPMVADAAPNWNVPTLLAYAGDDRLLNTEGSRKFAANAPARLVTVHRYDHLWHDIFNELDAAPVFKDLRDWLDHRAAS